MIILSRHYLTNCNLAKGVQTFTDNPIVKTIDTSAHIMDWWNNYPSGFSPSEVYVSNLMRTKQTGTMLGYNETIESALIAELPLVEYENKHIDDLGDSWAMTPVFYKALSKHQAGLKQFWDTLDKNKDILVFTHGITIRLFYYLITNKSLPKYFPDIFKQNITTLGQLRIEHNADPIFVNII